MAKVTEMKKHGLTLFAWDVACVTFVIFIVSFFQINDLDEARARFSASSHFAFSLTPLSLALAVYALWILALVMVKSWNSHIAGTGMPEYLMLSKTVLAVLFVLAFSALVFKIDMSRKFVFTSLVLGEILLVVHRWMGRRWLMRKRRNCAYSRKTLVIGSPKNSLELIEKMVKDKTSGFLPSKLMVFKEDVPEKIAARLRELSIEIEFFHDWNFEYITQQDIETVIVVSSNETTPTRLRQISWALENSSIELIVASGLVDFAGTRLSSQVVAGAQFLFVETPKFEGFKFLAKTVMDFLLAIVVLVLISPVMLVTALAIWLEDFGPIFYAQERVGRNGKHFKMFKFRSMIVDADKMHQQLRAKAINPVNQRMYKDPNDPRLTKVGRFIRRYSIDELPQIFNVFNGSMSMVGPRPPLASEVAEYETHELRRLLIKPGITGLWQVSGRSTLSWDETIRLDLYYVENWTIFTDTLILLRTAKAVFDRTGAY